MVFFSRVPHTMSSRGAALSLLLFAALSWAAYSWPPLHFIGAGYNLADHYGENLGYRYFMAMRWVDGAPGDFIHPGQGVVVPFIQAAYYEVAKSIEPDLFGRILFFGDMTLLGAAIAMLALVTLIAIDRRLPWQVRLVLVSTPLAMAMTHQHLFGYNLYPDYFPYEKVLFLGAAYFVVRIFYGSPAPTWLAFLWLGAIAGVAAAIKINMGPIVLGLAAVPLAAIPIRTPARMFLIACVAAAATFVGLLGIYYGFDPVRMLKFLTDLIAFSRAQYEPFPWIDLVPWGSWSANTMSNLSWLFLLIVGLLVSQAMRAREPRFLWVAIVTLGIAATAFGMAVRRGGGSSYFDASMIFILLVAIAAAYPVSGKPPLPSAFAAGALVAWAAAWTPFNLHNYQTNFDMLLAPYSRWQQQLDDWNQKQKLPVLTLVPSNYFVVGSVEDMMMRGFSNFGSGWYDSNANTSRKILFPDHTFGSYDANIEGTPALIVEWATGDAPFPPVDAEMLANHKALIAAVLASRNIGDCLTLPLPHLPGAIVMSCVTTPKSSPH